MNKLQLLTTGIALSLASTAAFATPQYTGNTFSDGDLALNKGFGYYIWNESANPSNWSIRWTGDGADGILAKFSGSIAFVNQSLGSIDEFSFESTHSSIDEDDGDAAQTSLDGVSNFEWIAYTNTTGGSDGIDFTLDSNYELMEFKLSSNLFSYLSDSETLNDPGILGSHIYIGSDYETPNVLINKNGRQQFEILVPEPGTLALLGLGIAGLGAARRYKA